MTQASLFSYARPACGDCGIEMNPAGKYTRTTDGTEKLVSIFRCPNCSGTKKETT